MVKIIKVFNFIYSKYLGAHTFKCIEIIRFKILDVFNFYFPCFKNIADGSCCSISDLTAAIREMFSGSFGFVNKLHNTRFENVGCNQSEFHTFF